MAAAVPDSCSPIPPSTKLVAAVWQRSRQSAASDCCLTRPRFCDDGDASRVGSCDGRMLSGRRHARAPTGLC